MTVALFTHPAGLAHDTGPGHPECPDRLRVVLRALEHPDFVPLLREQAPLATRDQLALAHPAAYVDAMLAIRPAPGEFVRIDGDTLVSHGSPDAILRAAGGAAAAVDAVMEGWARAAFVAMRPPGHHAERAQAMGFCFFGNVAVAACHARARWGLRRIAVVDFDVHHGNGTQDIFWERGDVFYASVHADPATDYPFYWGHADERGEGEGEGTTLNLPLSQGTGIDAFRRAQGVALDAIARFAPGLLVVSFGADTWEGDPISHFRLTTTDYAPLARDIAGCGWPTAIVMEGGYAVEALGANVASFLSGF